jgi:hypothetical protein
MGKCPERSLPLVEASGRAGGLACQVLLAVVAAVLSSASVDHSTS